MSTTESEPDDRTARFGLDALGRMPRRLGDFLSLHELGRGGMGVVYEAIQQSLGRHVALKVLIPEVTGDPNRLKRFEREVRAAAQLSHPNIVPVFGVGRHEGV